MSRITLMKFKVSVEMIQFDNLRNDIKLTDSQFSDLASAPRKSQDLDLSMALGFCLRSHGCLKLKASGPIL